VIADFNKKKAELDAKYDRELLGEPRSWVPGTKAPKVEISDYRQEESDEHTLAVISDIDNFEQTYLEEYEKVYLKDKSGAKDLNHLAL
jgi:hypothetical protein